MKRLAYIFPIYLIVTNLVDYSKLFVLADNGTVLSQNQLLHLDDNIFGTLVGVIVLCCFIIYDKVDKAQK